MIKVGLTGGIGSGKTTVSRIFEALGVKIFYADIEAKKIYDDPGIRDRVEALLGDVAYDHGVLDRKKVAKIVFQNKDLLAKLNAIIHPAVGDAYNNWIATCANEPYVIKEAAILFESGSDKGLDRIITVAAPESLRIERVMQRDHCSEQDVRNRLSKQWTDEERNKRADYIIYNDGSKSLIDQVMAIHQELLSI